MNKAQPSRVKLLLAFAAIYFIWGSTYLAIEFSIETLPPYLMTGVRFFIAGGLLYLWARWRGAKKPTFIHWRSATIIGGLMLFGGMGTVAFAQQWVDSALAALIIAMVPVWMVLIEWIRPGGAAPGLRVFLGIIVSFVGLILLIGPGDVFGTASNDNLIGGSMILLATFLWSIGSIFSRTVKLPDSAMLSTAMQMFSASILLMLMGVFQGEIAQINVEAISLKSVLAMLYLSIIGSVVAFTAYIWLLKVAPPARVATYAYVNPVIAVFLGWAFNNELITVPMMTGAALIVTAVAIIISQQQRQSKVIPKSSRLT